MHARDESWDRLKPLCLTYLALRGAPGGSTRLDV